METTSDSAVLGDWGIDKLWTFEVEGSKWPKRQYHTLIVAFGFFLSFSLYFRGQCLAFENFYHMQYLDTAAVQYCTISYCTYTVIALSMIIIDVSSTCR